MVTLIRSLATYSAKTSRSRRSCTKPLRVSQFKFGRPKFASGMAENEPLQLAILGEQTDSGGDRVARGADRQQAAVEPDLS